MQNLLEFSNSGPQNALVAVPPVSQGITVLDFLDDAVLQFDIRQGDIVLAAANRPAGEMKLVEQEGDDQHLPDWLLRVVKTVFAKLATARSTGTDVQSIEHRCFEPLLNKQLRLKFVVHNPTNPGLSLLCIARPVDLRAERVGYLEKRSTKLIAHANRLDASRRDLEQQVGELKKRLSRFKKSTQFDLTTGLPTRAHFLENSSAELQRCRRYGHAMGLAVIEVLGFDEIVERSGGKAGDHAMAGFAQICESAYRQGMDFAGRLEEKRIGVVLPETDLAGALQFVDRLRTLIASTPLKVDGTVVYLGARIGVDAVQDEDQSIRQMLARISNTL